MLGRKGRLRSFSGTQCDCDFPGDKSCENQYLCLTSSVIYNSINIRRGAILACVNVVLFAILIAKLWSQRFIAFISVKEFFILLDALRLGL